MTTPARKLRVLFGPTSIADVARIEWPHAQVHHLLRVDSPDAPAAIRYDAARMQAAVRGRSVDPDLAHFILRLNEDTNCLWLAERERSGFFDGSFLAPVALANCARFAWSLLDEVAPDLLVFHNHPHELFTYVLLRLALYRRVVTYLVHFSALPWRACVSRYNADGAISKVKLRHAWSEAEAAGVDNYMRRLRSSHESAIPHTDRALIAADSKALDLKNELLQLLRGSPAKNLLRTWRKWAVYRAFRAAVSDPPVGPYVVFLMHYQPEESTMPRGGVFAQQLNAIIRLRSALPEQVAIVVKENKATFRAPLALAIGVRSHDFYAALRSLPNTSLVPLERDTFDLIDHALAVATITGSVGLEALCRGKPVLIFGDANYESFAGVTRLGSEVSGPALKRVMDSAGHDPASTRRDLLGELLLSVGSASENNETNALSQVLATVQAFEYLGANLEQLAVQAHGEAAVAQR